MLECWPSVLPCLFAEGLSAALREASGDLAVVLRELGIDSGFIAYSGWTVAAALYLRVRLDRLRPRPPVPPAPVSAPVGHAADRGSPDRGAG